MIEYKPAKLPWATRRKAVDDVISEIGNMTETKGVVKNDAAKTIEHMLGPKAAKMFGATLADLKANPQQYSAVFKDKGLRMKALSMISEKARVTDFPTTGVEVFDEFSQYMEYCECFYLAPSLGMFAVWCGTSLADFEKRIKQYKMSRPDASEALTIAKEVIRGFIESKAVDGDIPPAVYLHQNKAYFDAIETTAVKHETITDSHVRDADQIAEVIDLIPDAIKHAVQDV